MLRSLFFVLFLWGLELGAQNGGRHVFQFLSLPSSARLTALGGSAPATDEADLQLGLANPAVLQSGMHRELSLQQTSFAAGLAYGQAGFAYSLHDSLTFSGAVQYLSYGQITQTNAEGQVLGQSRRNADYALQLGAGYRLYERLSLGVNAKLILSYLADRHSSGLALDMAARYRDTTRRLVVGLLLRNMGRQLRVYELGQLREPLPFEVMLGISHRLEHLPFRVSLTGQHLQRWDIRYDDPNVVAISSLGVPQERSAFAKGVDNFFRHLIFAGEFLLGSREQVQLRFGYNHLRAAEMRVAGLRNLAGFSFGLGMDFRRLRFDYGFGAYHFAGSLHHIGLALRFW